MKAFDYSLVKDPQYFCDNRMEAHSDHVYYRDGNEMQTAVQDGTETSFRYSLNGLWKFHYARNYKSAVQGFEKEDYCCYDWEDIHVPAHIQMEGYDAPQYANVQYPWEGHEELHPGQIPERFNPVASYVRYFHVPESMKGKRVFVSFQGAESGLALWLNGKFVGYSEDSFTPSEFELTEYLKDVKPVIEENHMYIRIASNDFFAVSKDVVSKMISGEYDAEQAYQSFNAQLLEEKSISEKVILDSPKSYSNHFHSNGGNEAYSVMANTLRNIYGTDVLIATGNSFTGNVLKAGYTRKMARSMIMPNSLSAYSSTMSGAELKETVRNFIEGYEGGFIPFNRGSLPVLSGISVEVKETDDGYTLSKVTKDGKKVQDNDVFMVTCLAIPKHMKAYPADADVVFEGEDTTVKDTWTAYVSGGNAVLAEPEDYITLR